MSFDRIVSSEGQRLQRILPPEELGASLKAAFFLRGPMMDRAGGDPGEAWKIIGGQAAGLSLVAPAQVHGTAIVEGGKLWGLPSRPKADGIYLENPQCAGSLRFADCYPVLLASAFPHPWALMLHAGFEGTSRGIIGRSFSFLVKRAGGIRAPETFAWIGPGIGACCYCRNKERDPKTALGLSTFPSASWEDLGERVRFDIRKALELQLLSQGLPRSNIFSHGSCTSCNHGDFYSYRTGDSKGRILFVVRCGPEVHNFTPWWENI